MPKLIATDLDGTLIRTDGTVSERTVAAVARAEEAGISMVMVTGRPPRWMHEVARQLGHRGQAICANGAVLYDLHTEEILSRRTIGVEVLSETVTRLRFELPELRFAVEYGEDFAYESSYRIGRGVFAPPGGKPVDDEGLVSRPATKLLALHPPTDVDELARRAHCAVGDLVTITHSSRHPLLEISASGVTKASALSDYCATRSLTPADVIAFGDMPNDLPMLTWAGRAYAMDNAHHEVLAAVPLRTSSNDHDGVARILESLLEAPA
ncbi:Cof-type HAD-IIB family hydrolase [Actinocorallia sp. B10E7]|uniref:Cof-type HAD-IIB family hydrolase n=1 Tax=Actinocorallia sp. B10E7 TaxID=3153558 RepID=UPI00325CFF40